jgi:hypothetical protein
MEKLVAANSYPYLDLMRSTSLLDGGDAVEYELVNNGVGPARVEWVELKFKGKAVHDIDELLDACCASIKRDYNGLNPRGSVANTLIRPGSSLKMFTWSEKSVLSPSMAALHRQMDNISYSTCYCSVFEECYVRVNDDRKPEPVKQCTPPAVPFRPDIKDNRLTGPVPANVGRRGKN